MFVLFAHGLRWSTKMNVGDATAQYLVRDFSDVYGMPISRLCLMV